MLRDLLNLEKALSSKLMKILIREGISFQLAMEKISLIKDIIAREQPLQPQSNRINKQMTKNCGDCLSYSKTYHGSSQYCMRARKFFLKIMTTPAAQ